MATIRISEENYDFLTKLAGEIQAKEGGVKTPNDAFDKMREGYMEFLKGYIIPTKLEEKQIFGAKVSEKVKE